MRAMRTLRLPALFLRALLSTLWGRLTRSTPFRLPFQVELIVRFLRGDWAGLWRWPIEELRAELEGRPLPKNATSRVTVRDAEGAPVPSVWIEPMSGHEDRVVLYFHGGSYQFGSHRTHADTLARIALAAKARVLAPDYRRAPEHTYPAQREDAEAIYRWLIERVPPSRVAVAGESAGGNLVVALLVALRDAGVALPACAAPISAWLDLAATRPSMTENLPTDFGSLPMLLAQARVFAGELPLEDPRVSPLFADLHGLPPLWVQYGDAELLRDENVELVERVRAAGGEAIGDPVPGHPHAPLFFAEWSPEAQRAVDRMGAWLMERTRG